MVSEGSIIHSELAALCWIVVRWIIVAEECEEQICSHHDGQEAKRSTRVLDQGQNPHILFKNTALTTHFL